MPSLSEMKRERESAGTCAGRVQTEVTISPLTDRLTEAIIYTQLRIIAARLRSLLSLSDLSTRRGEKKVVRAFFCGKENFCFLNVFLNF